MWEEIMTTIQQAFSNMALTSTDLFNVLFSLIVSILIGFVISQVYKITHRGVSYEVTFMSSLVLLAPIVAMVMFFIRGNLVLSLGLVGSLAIIRFRTPIKDTRDMVFLFWSIAVGLGAGTFHWTIVALASLTILLVAVVLYLVKYGDNQSHDYILIVNGFSEFTSQPLNVILKKYSKDVKIRSQNFEDDGWEIVYELHYDKARGPIDEMVKEVKSLEMTTSVSLLAPQLALPA
jgi:hypothetical protein